MPITDDNTISWDRKDIASTDALGHPVQSSASGFPQNIKGSWQPRASSKQNPQGQTPHIDVEFYSETFHTGRVGDEATYGGLLYRVVKATPPRSGASFTYSQYGLARTLEGSQQP